MARKPSQKVTATAAAAAPAAELQAIDTADRISFPLTSEGYPDWEAMRTGTKERLSTVLKDPRIPSMFGVAPVTKEFSEKEAQSLWDMIGRAETWAASRFMGLPPDLSARVFAYSPDEVVLLAKPTSEIANKYGGPLMAKYGPEIELLLHLGKIHAAKFELLRMEILKLALEQKKAQQAKETGADAR